MNKRERREKYLSTRRPTDWLLERAEQKAVESMSLAECYQRIKESGVEIPENIRQIARERGFE